MTARLERHQVALYVAAIVSGAVVGILAPAAGGALEPAITPVLALLLYSTFLAVPLATIGRALRDRRFLLTLAVVNVVVAPVVVFVLSRFVVDSPVLLTGLVLVLVAPCVDYVIVFTGIAGGSHERLLAATPLLMLAQMLLLPLYLVLIVGEGAAVIDPAPFVQAFLLLIVAPLAAAGLTQALARRHRFGSAISSAMTSAMVPLMMATLAVVVASQIASIGADLAAVLRLVPLYAAFVVVMTAVGVAAGRVARLDTPGIRAVVFSGVTRNSLVVLPLALALPDASGASGAPGVAGTAALAVVTQNQHADELDEGLSHDGMLVLVRLVPRLVRDRVSSTG